ncbi:MAG: DUF692 domain-containing protein [Pseudonocardiaceae bacterium]
MSAPLPALGAGLGWRPEIAGVLERLPGLRFTEVVAESLTGAALPEPLAQLRRRDVTVVPHGIRLSLGSTEDLDAHRVAHLARCADMLDAPLVSEHLAFVRAGGIEAGHLLPVPRTRDALDVLVGNVHTAQAQLPVPLALEPIAALFEWPEDEMDEAAFLTELLERTGAWLLLDVANWYANAINRGTEPGALLARLPLERIACLHVAGGAEHDGRYHDTHTDPVPTEVLTLLGEVCALRWPPAILLERDGDYPPEAQLRAELDAVAHAAGLAPITGEVPAR